MSLDEKYLPTHYKVVSEPFFKGIGELNVNELETLCEHYREYVHQQQIIKHRLVNELNELKG